MKTSINVNINLNINLSGLLPDDTPSDEAALPETENGGDANGISGGDEEFGCDPLLAALNELPEDARGFDEDDAPADDAGKGGKGGKDARAKKDQKPGRRGSADQNKRKRD